MVEEFGQEPLYSLGAWLYCDMVLCAFDDNSLDFMLVCWRLFFGLLHVESQYRVKFGEGLEAAVGVLCVIYAAVVIDVV